MRPARWLFAWLFLFFALGTGGHLYSPDAVLRGRATEGLVLRGSLAVDPTAIPPGFLAPGRGGRMYAKFDGGMSVAAIPFFMLGDALARWAPGATAPLFAGPGFLWYHPEDRADAWRFFGMGLTNAAVVAATCALLFALLMRLGYGPAPSLATAAVAAFASPLWVYTKDMFAEPLVGFGLVVFAFGWQRARATGRTTDALLAGSGLGLACFAKLAHVILVPLALGLFAWGLPKHGRLRRLAAVGAGTAVGLALSAAWNFARFGAFTTTGYGEQLQNWSTPPLTGLAGLLLSPGRGLLWHWPLVLLALLGTGAAWRRHRELTLFAWGTLLVLLAFYCRWQDWDGGWSWGPRFLLPALPLLAILIAPFFAEPPKGRLTRALGWALILVSTWVAWTGTLVPTTDFHQFLRRQAAGGNYLEVARWSWDAFPPFAYLSFGPKEYSIFVKSLSQPDAWWLAALLGAGWAALIPLGRATLGAVLGWPPPRRATLLWSAGGAVLAAMACATASRL